MDKNLYNKLKIAYADTDCFLSYKYTFPNDCATCEDKQECAKHILHDILEEHKCTEEKVIGE